MLLAWYNLSISLAIRKDETYTRLGNNSVEDSKCFYVREMLDKIFKVMEIVGNNC